MKHVNGAASAVFALLALVSGGAGASDQTLEFGASTQGNTPAGEASAGYCVFEQDLPGGKLCIGQSDGSSAQQFASTLNVITSGVLEVAKRLECAAPTTGYNVIVGGAGAVTISHSENGGPTASVPLPIPEGASRTVGFCK